MMNIYAEIALASAAVTYVVDVSGFTDSWRGLVQRIAKVKILRPLPPFDCSTCMTFWTSLVLCIVRGNVSAATFAACCGASLLAMPLGIAMNALRDLLATLASKIGGRT